MYEYICIAMLQHVHEIVKELYQVVTSNNADHTKDPSIL